jgi:ubiquinone/menaquinone biosynthesis C-methylase UbiE
MVQSKQWQANSKRQWDDKATFWHSNSKEMWDTGSRCSIIPFFSKYIKKSAKVADIGCGDGYGSFKLFSEGFHVTGVDLSTEMIRLAKNRETDSLKFIQASINEMPFRANEFDAILSINCIEWTEDPQVSLNCLHHILKPGGHLCIGILGPTAQPRKNSYPRLYGEQVICNTMMPWEFEQLAKENGWNSIEGFGIYKRGVIENDIQHLSKELKQALTFMWVFLLQKKE